MHEEFDRIHDFLQRYADFRGLGWWIIDYANDPRHFYCNDEMKRMFHLPPNQRKFSIAEQCPIAGDYNRHIEEADREKAAKIFREYHDLLENRSDEYENDFPYRDVRSGEERYFKSQAKVIERDAAGAVRLIHGVIQEVTYEKRLEKAVTRERERFKELSEIDPLTGLMNRRRFQARFIETMEASGRHGHPLGIVMIDIDEFKRYNDAEGHPAGDEVLRAVARILLEHTRRDTDLCARYGGEEFVMVQCCRDRETFERSMRRLLEKVREARIPHPDSSVSKWVTISLGGHFHDPSKAPERTDLELIRLADENLYRAKKAGRDRAVFGI